MFHIRPFDYTDQDYAAALAVSNAVWPDLGETVTVWQHRDEARDKSYFYQRFVAADADKVVAVGFCMETAWLYRPGKYFLRVDVHPAYEHQGIGTALYEHMLHILEQRALPPTMLVSHAREDKPQGLRFLEKHGFVQVMRSPVSKLALSRFEPAKFAGMVEKVRASGIQLVSVAALDQAGADWRRQLYELDWICTQDEPLPDAPTRPPYEEYVKLVFDPAYFLPEASFAALDNGQYVAMTTCGKSAGDSTLLSTNFTGVLRTHRRRGIATALKLLTIAYAQRQHFSAIETGNEEHNPMLQINLAIGFQPEPAWVDFQKILVTHQQGAQP